MITRMIESWCSRLSITPIMRSAVWVVHFVRIMCFIGKSSNNELAREPKGGPCLLTGTDVFHDKQM